MSMKFGNQLGSLRWLALITLCLSFKISISHLIHHQLPYLNEEKGDQTIDDAEYYGNRDNRSQIWLGRDLRRRRRRRRRRQPKTLTKNVKSLKSVKDSKYLNRNNSQQMISKSVKSVKSTKSPKHMPILQTYSFDSSYTLRMTIDGNDFSEEEAWMIANELQVVTEIQVRDQVLANNPTVPPSSITVVTSVSPVLSTIERRLRVLQVNNSLEFRVETSVTISTTASNFDNSGSSIETRVKESVETAVATQQASQILLQKLKESSTENSELNKLIETIKDMERKIDFPTLTPTTIPSVAPSVKKQSPAPQQNIHGCLNAATMLYNNCTFEECALRSLFLATDGCNQWTKSYGWNPLDSDNLGTPIPYCNWHGVKCAIDGTSSITELDLHNNNLVGEIPTEIGLLQDLTYLYLNNNQLNGTIPSEIGLLQKLDIVFLMQNQLHGIIPTEIGFLQSATLLDLDANYLHGNIPTEIGNMKSLLMLYVSNNFFLDGTIPSEIGLLTSLVMLGVEVNSLTGTIPSEMGQMKQLFLFNMSYNLLTGTIPVELCSLLHIPTYQPYNIPSEENGFNAYPSVPYHSVRPKSELMEFDYSGNNLIPCYSNDCKNGTKDIVESCQSISSTSIRCALMTFFSATNGCEWYNNSGWWDNYPYIVDPYIFEYCDWYGVDCDPNHDTAYATPPSPGFILNLNDNNLRGSLPIEIGWFNSDLWGLHLANNSLEGTVPSEIGKLTMLQSVSLSHNQINGTIPSVIGDLSQLEYIDLSNNILKGTVPVELNNASNLRTIQLDMNEFSGTIPGLAHLGLLHTLSLQKNKIEGKISSEIGLLMSLENLRLDGNYMTGSIPSEIGFLTYLRELILYDNDFTSTIPNEVGFLSSLSILELQFNNFTGTIPPDVCTLSIDLEKFQYDEGLIDGSCSNISPCIMNMTNSLRSCSSQSTECLLLSFFRATNGCNWTYNDGWTEGIPFCDWYGVFCIPFPFETIVFQLSDNNLRGTLPTDIGLISNLAVFDIFDNDLSGTIPTEIGHLSMLQSFVAYSNSFSGTLPSEINELTDLSLLILDRNKLTGTLSPEIGSLVKLESLWLSNNMLEGTLSSSLGNLTSLKALELSNNKFSGNLPSELGKLNNLEDFEFFNNTFTGTIPLELCANKENLKTFTYDIAELGACPNTR